MADIIKIEDVLKERGTRYGEFDKHAAIAQELKSAIYLADTGDAEGISKFNDVHREGIDMICHKLARIANGDPDYKDSWVDIAGYATLVANTLDD